ncbi:unnamed protein product [Effrenium voratum]|nr:unnamed protein product [Effrenium voratum]
MLQTSRWLRHLLGFLCVAAEETLPGRAPWYCPPRGIRESACVRQHRFGQAPLYVESSLVPLSVKVVLAAAQEDPRAETGKMAQAMLAKIEAIRLITCTGRFQRCYQPNALAETLAELCGYVEALRGSLGPIDINEESVCQALFLKGDGSAVLRAVSTPLQRLVERSFPAAAPPEVGNFGSRFNFEHFFAKRAEVLSSRVSGPSAAAQLMYPPIFSPSGICSLGEDASTQRIGPSVSHVLRVLRAAKVQMSHFVVNFGAADGECGTEEDWNADPANCLTMEGYSAVIIEGDRKFFPHLRRHYGHRENVSMMASDDHTFEYWAGNPSIEIIHGHIKVSGSRPAAASSGHSEKSGTETRMALASSVPCHMPAPELCDFLGAFGATSHRRFRHCRVLHGKNSEDYLIALLMASPADVEWLVQEFHGKRFNSIEPAVCSLHFVVTCSQAGLLEDSSSPSAFPRRWSGPQPRPELPDFAEKGFSPFMLPSSNVPNLERSPLMSPVSDALPELFLGAAGTQSFGDPKSVVSPTLGDRPFCTVCQETVDSNPSEYQLTELGGGVPLTILCGHTFHARCLSCWCDTRCPVCRFQQHPYQTSSCDVCGQAEGVHICLVCGAIGCTGPQGHAQQHFEATSHAYALDVNTQHVWDYAGNGYVHRLLYNSQDGKMVEHSAPEEGLTAQAVFGDLRWADWADMEDDDCEKIAALFTRAPGAGSSTDNTKKQEAIVSEFNNLLSTQLTAQREHFDELRLDIEQQNSQELRKLEEELNGAQLMADGAQQRLETVRQEAQHLERQVAELSAEEATAQRQRSQLEALNRRLGAEQKAFEEKQTGAEEMKRRRQQRDRQVAELQQEIRDLELFLQMRRRCENADGAEMQGAHLLVTESDRRTRRARRR